MILDNNKFILTSLGALSVIGGVTSKDMHENLGVALFIIGWLITAYSLSLSRYNKLVYWGASAAVLGSVLMMKQKKDKNEEAPLYLPIVYSLGWVAIGYLVGSHLFGNIRFAGLISSALVLASIAYTNSSIIDNASEYMYALAWGIIVILNSMI